MTDWGKRIGKETWEHWWTNFDTGGDKITEEILYV